MDKITKDYNNLLTNSLKFFIMGRKVPLKYLKIFARKEAYIKCFNKYFKDEELIFVGQDGYISKAILDNKTQESWFKLEVLFITKELFKKFKRRNNKYAN